MANADAESAFAGKGWVGDFGAVIEAEGGRLSKPFAIHCRPVDGQITALRILEDPDELDEIEPRYLARGRYSIWKGIIQGSVDPVEALLRGWISVQGDIQQLAERMKYKGIARRVLEQVSTQYVDEL